MLECVVTDDGGQVAHLIMHPSGPPKLKGELQDYIVEIIIDKGDSVGVARRFVHDWPTASANPLALVKAALALIDTGTTAIEGEYGGGVSPDLERQVRGALRAIQARDQTGQLRDNRPALWRGQSEQHGRDSFRQAAREKDCQRFRPEDCNRSLLCRYGCIAAEDGG